MALTKNYTKEEERMTDEEATELDWFLAELFAEMVIGRPVHFERKKSSAANTALNKPKS